MQAACVGEQVVLCMMPVCPSFERTSSLGVYQPAAARWRLCIGLRLGCSSEGCGMQLALLTSWYCRHGKLTWLTGLYLLSDTSYRVLQAHGACMHMMALLLPTQPGGEPALPLIQGCQQQLIPQAKGVPRWPCLAQRHGCLATKHCLYITTGGSII